MTVFKDVAPSRYRNPYIYTFLFPWVHFYSRTFNSRCLSQFFSIENTFYFRIWLVQYIPCNGLLLFSRRFNTIVQGTATKAQYDNSKIIPLINNNVNKYALKAVNVQPTKAYRERRYSPTYSGFDIRWRSGQLYAPIASLRGMTRPPGHPPYRRLDGPHSLCGDLEKDTKILTLPRIKRLLSSPARRYSTFRRVSGSNY